MNFRIFLVIVIAFFALPISANPQDSLSIFKEKKLSQQFAYVKERLNTSVEMMPYINELLKAARSEKDTNFMAQSYYLKHRVYRKNKLYSEAHAAIDSAISLAQLQQKDSLLGSFYHAKGATFYIASQYSEALELYLKAYDVMRVSGSISNRLTLEFDVATIKLKVGKTAEALAEFDNIIRSYDSLLTQKPDSRFLKIRFVKMLNNTAKSYTEAGMFQRAHDLYSKSLVLSETTDFLSGKCIAIGGKGNVFTAQQAYEKALVKLDEALKISTNHEDLYLITPFLLLDKGKCWFGLNDYEKALNYFRETDEIIQEKQLNFVGLDETYQWLAKTYVQLGNYEKATEIYDQYIERKNISTDRRFELYKTIFEGYDLKNVEYRADKAEKSSNLFKNYFSQAMVAIVLIVIASGIFFVYYRNRQKQKLAKFHTLIQELKEKESSTENASQKGYVLSDEKAAKILEYLEKLEAKQFFLDAKYNLATLAKKCHTNSSYLSKVINQYKEKTFSEYMNDMRIDYVLTALKNDKKLRSYTVQSIAEEIGFKKSESFAKAFKKRTGFNPSYYIKNLENL
ncbi:tetratricopeptide repeat protein [Kordia periserrulae]|uniref:Tetratricopeptide repeat protein n=1 Tax=Kordia periserrulae TaxID=701523 RepID=A0A2T6BVJ5_9FLAO|nr:response regulator transcription factor [Kordia periserrulae]PTX60046.1 tetratricopeptide repeat protein [Kordia periserrulae]